MTHVSIPHQSFLRILSRSHFHLGDSRAVEVPESTIFVNLNSSYCRSKATVV